MFRNLFTPEGSEFRSNWRASRGPSKLDDIIPEKFGKELAGTPEARAAEVEWNSLKKGLIKQASESGAKPRDINKLEKQLEQMNPAREAAQRKIFGESTSDVASKYSVLEEWAKKNKIDLTKPEDIQRLLGDEKLPAEFRNLVMNMAPPGILRQAISNLGTGVAGVAATGLGAYEQGNYNSLADAYSDLLDNMTMGDIAMLAFRPGMRRYTGALGGPRSFSGRVNATPRDQKILDALLATRSGMGLGQRVGNYVSTENPSELSNDEQLNLIMSYLLGTDAENPVSMMDQVRGIPMTTGLRR